MSSTTQSKKSAKSYEGFEEGSYAARKGRLCLIKKIDFSIHPPSVVVQMMDTQGEVGTEFDRLKHVESWICNVCSAPNKDISAKNCHFCKLARSFDEKIILQGESLKNENKSSPEQGTDCDTQPEPNSAEIEPEIEETVPEEPITEESDTEDSDVEENEEVQSEEAPEPEPEQQQEQEHEEYEPIREEPIPQQSWNPWQAHPKMRPQGYVNQRPQRPQRRRSRPMREPQGYFPFSPFGNFFSEPEPQPQPRYNSYRRPRSSLQNFWGF